MARIVFVCTGNVFRSMSADFALKSALPANSNIQVSSAGTRARPEKKSWPEILKLVRENGADATQHIPTLLTADIIHKSDLIVVMSTDHQDFIKEKFNHQATLYWDIVKGEKIPFLDVHEAVPTWRTDRAASNAYLKEAVDTIFAHKEQFLKNLPRFLPAQQTPKPPAPNGP